jgi:hypothetical protein
MKTSIRAIFYVTLFLVGLFICTGIYNFDQLIAAKGGEILLTRTHRLTGRTKYFIDGKWAPPEKWIFPESKRLPYEEQIKIIGDNEQLKVVRGMWIDFDKQFKGEEGIEVIKDIWIDFSERFKNIENLRFLSIDLGVFRIQVHNDSSWTITDMIVQIEVPGDEGVEKLIKFKVTQKIPPFSIRSIDINFNRYTGIDTDSILGLMFIEIYGFKGN